MLSLFQHQEFLVNQDANRVNNKRWKNDEGLTDQMLNTLLLLFLLLPIKISFMVIGENREKDLAQLETFVKREKLAGQIVHLFYHHLRSVYPLEFIYLARKHNKSNAGHQYYIQQAKEQINRAYSKMNNYLIIPPVALNDTYFMESNIDSNGKFDRIKQALKIFDLGDELMIKYAEE